MYPCVLSDSGFLFFLSSLVFYFLSSSYSFSFCPVVHILFRWARISQSVGWGYFIRPCLIHHFLSCVYLSSYHSPLFLLHITSCCSSSLTLFLFHYLPHPSCSSVPSSFPAPDFRYSPLIISRFADLPYSCTGLSSVYRFLLHPLRISFLSAR